MTGRRIALSAIFVLLALAATIRDVYAVSFFFGVALALAVYLVTRRVPPP